MDDDIFARWVDDGKLYKAKVISVGPNPSDAPVAPRKKKNPGNPAADIYYNEKVNGNVLAYSVSAQLGRIDKE